MLPRYWLALHWTATMTGLPPMWWKPLSMMKDFVVLPALGLSYFFMDPMLVTKELTYLTQPLDIWNLKTLTGAVKVYLTTPHLANVEIMTPFANFVYKLPLPVSIENIPVGTVQYTLVEKLSTILQPVCYHGLNMFKTFDEMRFRYNIANLKCEHVLLQSCATSLPKFMVLVKPMRDWRIIRIIMPGAEIRLIPKSAHVTTIMVSILKILFTYLQILNK